MSAYFDPGQAPVGFEDMMAAAVHAALTQMEQSNAQRLSKREEFAKAALQGLLSNQAMADRLYRAEAVAAALQYADDMLTALATPPVQP